MCMRISRRFRFVCDEVPVAKCRIVSTSAVRTGSEEWDRSTEHLMVKYFCRGWLEGEQEKHAAFAVDGVVWRLYQAGSPVPLLLNFTLLKQYCSPKTI